MSIISNSTWHMHTSCFEFFEIECSVWDWRFRSCYRMCTSGWYPSSISKAACWIRHLAVYMFSKDIFSHAIPATMLDAATLQQLQYQPLLVRKLIHVVSRAELGFKFSFPCSLHTMKYKIRLSIPGTNHPEIIPFYPDSHNFVDLKFAEIRPVPTPTESSL